MSLVQGKSRCRRPSVTRVAAITIAALAINSALSHFSIAQTVGLPPPEYTVKDQNGVDLLTFNLFLDQTDLSIGSKEHPLTHNIFSAGDGAWLVNTLVATGDTRLQFLGKDSYGGGVSGWPTGNCNHGSAIGAIKASIGEFSESFTCIGNNVAGPAAPSGSTLVRNTDLTSTYTKGDGEQILYSASGALTQVLYPDGRVLTWWYYDDGTGAPLLRSVTRSDGLQLKYTYAQLASGAWSTVSVTAINNAYEYCNPTASTCSLSMVWPTVSYAITQSTSGAIFTVTDAAGRVTRYTLDAATWAPYGRTVAIKLPSSASADNITYAYCDNSSGTWCSNFASVGWPAAYYYNYVTTVTRNGQVWSYNGTPGSPAGNQCGNATYGFTNPAASGRQVALLDCPPPPSGALLPPVARSTFLQLTDEGGVQYNAYPNGVTIQNVVKPEGNQTDYAWDGNVYGQMPTGRGNLTQETLVPKSASPLAQVNLLANYDTTCTNQFTCNQPNWVQDGRGSQTHYTYDPTHGGVLTKTSPADSNGIQPQTRYTYIQRYAWVLNSSGVYVKSAAPIWVLSTESFCRTSAVGTSGTGCTQAGDEVVKTYEYGPDSGPNNLFLKGLSVTADGATYRTCYGYDMYGNKVSQTEPNANLASCP